MPWGLFGVVHGWMEGKINNPSFEINCLVG